MKKISQKENERLLEYLDGTLNSIDKEKLEHELEHSGELRNRLEELSVAHYALKEIKLQEPSRNFTQAVMSGLDRYPVQSGASTSKSILLLAGVLIAVGIGALLISAGVFDGASTINLSDVVIQNEYINFQKSLPSIPINGKLIVNIIILLNLALALIVLDRTILRPWFERRAKMNY